MIEVVDRVPTYPNRIKITHANGTSEYVTWERADAPTVEGTPINKALFDSIAADIGLRDNLSLYVSNAGSDALGDGTEANPFASVSKALSVIPKNLNGYVAYVNIGAGVYNETVMVDSFCGGKIVFTGAINETVAFTNLYVRNKSVVEVRNIQVDVSSGYISIINDGFLGVHTSMSVNGSANGVQVVDRGQAVFYNNLLIYNTTNDAVSADSGGFVYVNNLGGNGNRLGIAASGGATVAFNTNTIGAAIGYYSASGGRILSGSQTSIPDY